MFHQVKRAARKAVDTVKAYAGQATAVAGAAVAGMSHASAAVAPIDTTDILAQISAGQVAGVAVCIAFGVAVWAIKSGKLMRRG